MSKCNPQILFQEGSFSIAQCSHCLQIGFSFHNILTGFTPKGYAIFCKNVLQSNFQECCVEFPDGSQQIILQSCHRDIQFSFTQDEFKILKKGIRESLLLLEAHYVLNNF